MIRNLFFDWDNTIWDFSANSKLSLIECYEKFNLNQYFGAIENFLPIYYEVNDGLWAQYRQNIITKDYLIKTRFNETFKRFGLDNYELSMQVNDAYLDFTTYKKELVEGAEQTLKTLKDLGYKLYVITNGFLEVQKRKMRNSGIEHLFEASIISDEAGALKPSKQFFDYAFKTTGVSPNETLVIGDDIEADIAGAIEYGLKCVFFNRKGVDCKYKVDAEIKRLEELINIIKSLNKTI
ncbi:MAG: YjjG family noncanonical pyrimidine nucleotidase [Bacteroidales bacterium]|nr:YjjG family noncanonical pyrimidine nucleotidase [Bacteroidales bacterium]